MPPQSESGRGRVVDDSSGVNEQQLVEIVLLIKDFPPLQKDKGEKDRLNCKHSQEPPLVY